MSKYPPPTPSKNLLRCFLKMALTDRLLLDDKIAPFFVYCVPTLLLCSVNHLLGRSDALSVLFIHSCSYVMNTFFPKGSLNRIYVWPLLYKNKPNLTMSSSKVTSLCCLTNNWVIYEFSPILSPLPLSYFLVLSLYAVQ